jgi:hypothetical protein
MLKDLAWPYWIKINIRPCFFLSHLLSRKPIKFAKTSIFIKPLGKSSSPMDKVPKKTKIYFYTIFPNLSMTQINPWTSRVL